LSYLEIGYWSLFGIWDLACLREAASAKAGDWNFKRCNRVSYLDITLRE
jgi:hypothetical protein